eukprot:3832316-Prymnesium_polylepis.1
MAARCSAERAPPWVAPCAAATEGGAPAQFGSCRTRERRQSGRLQLYAQNRLGRPPHERVGEGV